MAKYAARGDVFRLSIKAATVRHARTPRGTKLINLRTVLKYPTLGWRVEGLRHAESLSQGTSQPDSAFDTALDGRELGDLGIETIFGLCHFAM